MSFRFMKSVSVYMLCVVMALCSTSSFATTEQADQSIAPRLLSSLPLFDINRFYVNLQTGFFARNVADSSVIGAELVSNNTYSVPYSWKHGHYGWTTGLGAGWSFLNDYSLEWAGFWSSRQQMTINGGSGDDSANDSFCLNLSCFASGSTVSMQSWWSYLVVRGQFLLDEHWYANARLGFAYMHNSYKSTLTANSETTAETPVDISGVYSGHVNVFSPTLGLGVSYYVVPRAWLELNYQLMLGSHTADDSYFNSSSYSVNKTHVPLWQTVLLSLNVRL